MVNKRCSRRDIRHRKRYSAYLETIVAWVLVGACAVTLGTAVHVCAATIDSKEPKVVILDFNSSIQEASESHDKNIQTKPVVKQMVQPSRGIAIDELLKNKEDEKVVSSTLVNTEATETGIRKIRCTVYYDTGATASGEWTRSGILAGKHEWLNRDCILYRVNADGTMGEQIGTFTFKDTGFGLRHLNGKDYPNGTIKSGVSIDMWHPSEEECWNWIAQYGDYVYIEFIN